MVLSVASVITKTMFTLNYFPLIERVGGNCLDLSLCLSLCQRKHREFGNFAKTQGIWFAQVVNYLILKVQDISIFAAKISIFFL